MRTITVKARREHGQKAKMSADSYARNFLLFFFWPLPLLHSVSSTCTRWTTLFISFFSFLFVFSFSFCFLSLVLVSLPALRRESGKHWAKRGGRKRGRSFRWKIQRGPDESTSFGNITWLISVYDRALEFEEYFELKKLDIIKR